MLARARVFISALFLSLITATAAMAAPIFSSGTFGYALPNATGTNVAILTDFVTEGKAVVLSRQGWFLLSPFDTFTVPSHINFNLPSTFSWSLGDIGNLAANTIVKGDVTINGDSATAIWYVYGTFTVGSDYANAGSVLGAIQTIALTQTGGPGQSISYSGTVYVPPPNSNIPEPATLLLIGGGALLIGFRKRRKA